jgi:hypothetical protein
MYEQPARETLRHWMTEDGLWVPHARRRERAEGQPNDSGGGEDCAVLHSGMGKWNDVACDSTAFDSILLTIVCEP